MRGWILWLNMDDKGGFLDGKEINAGKIKSAQIAFLDARVDFMAEYG